MCKAVRLFGGLDAALNKKAATALDALRALDVVIEVVKDCAIIGEQFELPCITTDEGERYFGVSAIERFVQQQHEVA